MDAQYARNSLWPENASSPVVMLTLTSLCAALDQLMAFPYCPLPEMIPRLDAFVMGLAPLACETLAAMAEGDATFDPVNMPSQRSIQQEIEEIRAGLASCVQGMITWRLNLPPHDGVGFDRRVYSVILCSDELLYHDTFPMIGVIRHVLATMSTAIQASLAQRAQLTGSAALQGAPRPEQDNPSQ